MDLSHIELGLAIAGGGLGVAYQALEIYYLVKKNKGKGKEEKTRSSHSVKKKIKKK